MKNWVGLATAVETLRQHRAQSMLGAARTRSTRRGGMDGPHGPTSTATLYVQKQDMQAGFLHPSILGTMGAS